MLNVSSLSPFHIKESHTLPFTSPKQHRKIPYIKKLKV